MANKWRKRSADKVYHLALPIYVMSTMLLPIETCENLGSVIAQFWWSSNLSKRGIHWVKWEKEKLCKSREEEGIGFRMIHEFILALLGKQLWRLVQVPYSLVVRVLRRKLDFDPRLENTDLFLKLQKKYLKNIFI